MTRSSTLPLSLPPAPGPYCDPLEGCPARLSFSLPGTKCAGLPRPAAPDTLMTDIDSPQQLFPFTHPKINRATMWRFILPPIVLLGLALPQGRRDSWSHPLGFREIGSGPAQSSLVICPRQQSVKPRCWGVQGAARTMDAWVSFPFPVPIPRIVCPSKLWADFQPFG